MKASELRIGNLVDWNGEIAKVSQILELEVGFKCGESDLTKAIKPIPLTEEWLLNFGFKKCENGWKTLSICNDWTYLSWERLAGIELSVSKHSCMLPNINYVHQLQNLYFTLTGEELKIKQ
jgi:hypothetical protein